MTHKPIVIHDHDCWLPASQNWIYTQVQGSMAWVENHVVCETTQNLDRYPLSNLHVRDKCPRPRYTLTGNWISHWRQPRQAFLEYTARQIRPALLHSHFGNVGWQNLGVARRLGCKHAVTFYGVDVTHYPQSDRRWCKRYHELFRHVDAVFCEGPHMAQSIVKLGCPQEKTHVIHLGVRLEEIPFQRRQWDGQSPLRILMAATFREKKGLTYGIQAATRLADKGLPVELTIIGDALAEPRSQMEKQRITKALQDSGSLKTRLLGFVSQAQMHAEAAQHHIFLSPSVHAQDGDCEGGAPVGIIEMAASGMLIVSTTHCDIPQVVLHGQTGLLAPEGDIDALETHLLWAFEHAQDWPQMLRAGRAHIEREFNAQHQSQRLAQEYLALIG